MAYGESGEGGSTARRMVLGGQLRRLRESKGVTRPEAGHAIRASESKISRLELGRVSFKERDVEDLLTLYGVSDDSERETFLDLVRASNQPGWWQGYGDALPRWFQDYVGLEESASRIQTVELTLMPGLLQTESYARAVIARGHPGDSEDDITDRVRLRTQRQRILANPNAPRLWFVLDEAVLHHRVGGDGVMRDQIQHLLDTTRLPSVSLQVLPFELGASLAEGSFALLRFAEPELPDVVYLEHLRGALYVDKPSEVEEYSKVVYRLAAEAMTPDETRKQLMKRLAEF